MRWLCLDASAVDDVDFSAAEVLRSIFASLKEKGIRLIVMQVNIPELVAGRNNERLAAPKREGESGRAGRRTNFDCLWIMAVGWRRKAK